MTELLVAVAIVGVLALLSLPTFFSYFRSAALKGAAQEVTTLLNGARQLAIRRNGTVCVGAPTAYGTQMQYYDTICTGAALKLPGTDANGNMTLSNNMQLKGPANAVTFSYLGAAALNNGNGIYYICNPQNTTQHAEVTVSTSGRLTTAYMSTACP